MNPIDIDLYSDTHTKPTKAMRAFMAAAEVGDEQQKADPTVNRLVERVCEISGKEDAIYLPSGTMCNQIAFRIHCRPGDEIIMDETAHTRHYETGGPAAHSGASIQTIRGERGIFSADQLLAAIRPPMHHHPRSRVVLIEQTTNLGGGSIWPLETIREIGRIAGAHNLALHMDGARLMNAVVETGIPASAYAEAFDSLWIDFSKGLGAPVGAALAGSKSFIEEAWRWKHQFGGAMRQAGIIAAGALYALDHHTDRLAEDHANARRLAGGLSAIEGIDVEPVETNILFFNLSSLNIDSDSFNDLCATKGLCFSPLGKTRVRAVTHMGVSPEQIDRAIDIVRQVVRSLASPKRHAPDKRH
jgi:threonine aldolase